MCQTFQVGNNWSRLWRPSLQEVGGSLSSWWTGAERLEREKREGVTATVCAHRRVWTGAWGQWPAVGVCRASGTSHQPCWDTARIAWPGGRVTSRANLHAEGGAEATGQLKQLHVPADPHGWGPAASWELRSGVRPSGINAKKWSVIPVRPTRVEVVITGPDPLNRHEHRTSWYYVRRGRSSWNMDFLTLSRKLLISSVLRWVGTGNEHF